MILDGFKITKKIYHSQSTQILRAIRETDGRPVILKVRSKLVSAEPEPSLDHDYELGKPLEGERSIRHLALEQTDQKSVLVLHDDQMSPLEPAIPKRGFDLPRFLKLATEITSAIEEIHAQGVIHKDINPASIIVNASLETIKLIDFGLATRISEEMVGFESPAVLQGILSHVSLHP